jgi:hypothetical protein
MVCQTKTLGRNIARHRAAFKVQTSLRRTAGGRADHRLRRRPFQSHPPTHFQSHPPTHFQSHPPTHFQSHPPTHFQSQNEPARSLPSPNFFLDTFGRVVKIGTSTLPDFNADVIIFRAPKLQRSHSVQWKRHRARPPCAPTVRAHRARPPCAPTVRAHRAPPTMRTHRAPPTVRAGRAPPEKARLASMHGCWSRPPALARHFAAWISSVKHAGGIAYLLPAREARRFAMCQE